MMFISTPELFMSYSILLIGLIADTNSTEPSSFVTLLLSLLSLGLTS
nr:MAG TPA: hypothetical protein [Caudoviricetes sp.]